MTALPVIDVQGWEVGEKPSPLSKETKDQVFFKVWFLKATEKLNRTQLRKVLKNLKIMGKIALDFLAVGILGLIALTVILTPVILGVMFLQWVATAGLPVVFLVLAWFFAWFFIWGGIYAAAMFVLHYGDAALSMLIDRADAHRAGENLKFRNWEASQRSYDRFNR